MSTISGNEYHSDGFHSRLLPYRSWNLSFQRFNYFIFSLSDFGSSALLQEENKAAKSSNSFSPGHLHTGYRNRRLHRLLGSNKYSAFRWKAPALAAEKPSILLVRNSGSVKLSHELCDLLC